MKNFNKKMIVLYLVASFTFSPLLAIKAEAQLFVPTWSVEGTVTAANTTSISLKELGFDGVAFMVINLVIEKMAASTVKWINNGFQGSPGFITDPESFFMDIGDKIAGQYILGNPNLNFLCGSMGAKVRLALQKSYINEPVWQCTLTDAIGNVEDFLGDFNKGGWDKFFELTQKQQNNPIGAFLQAENELSLKIATQKGIEDKKLSWGNGFMSYESCKPGTTVMPGDKGTKEYCVRYDPANPKQCAQFKTVRSSDGVGVGDCNPKDKTIQTPGSVIQTQLNKTLGLGSERIAAADEINEIISALLNQLVSRIVGGIGKGLRSLSDKDATNKNQSSFTEILSNDEKDKQIEDYFKKSDQKLQDVVGAPPYDPDFCRNNPTSPDCLPPGSSGGASTQTPRDNDCAGIDQNTLASMANQNGINIVDLDCDPVGIH